MGYFGGSPYTLEVPVNEVHTMKISHTLHAVDKLQGSSASVPIMRSFPVPVPYADSHFV